MKTVLLSCLLLTLFFQGCHINDCPDTPAIDHRLSFEIDFHNYSENNYFIDEIYADTSEAFNIYNRFYGNRNPQVVPKYYVKNLEVYISINQPSQVITSITGNAYIDLPPRSYSSLYADSWREPIIPSPGRTEIERFRQLSRGDDYLIHPETGFITFLFPVEDWDVIAVAYNIENESSSESDDIYYGEFMAELVNSSKTHAVLKLIKPRNPVPMYSQAWKLKMKNIYQVAQTPFKIDLQDLDIYLKNPDGSEINSIENKRFMEIFGLDRFSINGSATPDGVFDRISGISFEPKTSEIIFPLLQPFGNNIPEILKDYKKLAVYDSLKPYTTQPGYNFVMRGKYTIVSE